jgi:hypothetical protein
MAEAMNIVVIVVTIALVVWVQVREYRRSPMCRWCDVRHRGRCIYNPRAGRVFANVNDGHFDYDDPNQ